MYKGYFTIGLRNLLHARTHSFINIIGLSLAIASCLLISLYIVDECSYDSYHDNAEKIYRVVATDWAKMPPALAPQMQSAYPHLVKQAVRFWPLFSPAKMRKDELVFVESDVVFTDASVFSIFSWPLVSGNPETALSRKNSIVLTESMAKKYFGTQDPLGRSMKFWGNDLDVTGVMKDVPDNSHLEFDFLISFQTLYDEMGANLEQNWGMPVFYTYLLLNNKASVEDLQNATRNVFKENFSDPSIPVTLQPLTSIHLDSNLQAEFKPGGNKSYLYILGTAGLFILILAGINFTNLNTARAITRTKEVGMRKSLGALKLQLVQQFFGESIITTSISLLTGLVLIGLVLPLFNQLSGKSIPFNALITFPFIAGILIILLTISFFAGAYPGLFLVRMKPAAALKGFTPKSNNSYIRKGLIVFQFVVSTFFLTAMLVVFLQLNFMQSKEMGFDKDQIIVLDGDGFTQVESEFSKLAGVEHIAGIPQIIPGLLPRTFYRASSTLSDTTNQMLHYGVTAKFVETMGMNLAAGRNFSESLKTDERAAFIINESAVKALGLETPSEAVGKPFSMLLNSPEGDKESWREGMIIGVVQDFHYQSLYNRIEPIALHLDYDINLTLVRVQSDINVLEKMEVAWKKVNPEAPFNYFNLKDRINQQYHSEIKLGNLIAIATTLAVVIACMGLLGLVTFSANQRTKEIGIRKVMGASGVQVIALVTKEFIILIIVAIFIALPLSFYALHVWINNFAYHISVSWSIFVVAALATMLVALTTMAAQTLKLSRAPVTLSLRSE